MLKVESFILFKEINTKNKFLEKNNYKLYWFDIKKINSSKFWENIKVQSYCLYILFDKYIRPFYIDETFNFSKWWSNNSKKYNELQRYVLIIVSKDYKNKYKRKYHESLLKNEFNKSNYNFISSKNKQTNISFNFNKYIKNELNNNFKIIKSLISIIFPYCLFNNDFQKDLNGKEDNKNQFKNTLNKDYYYQKKEFNNEEFLKNIFIFKGFNNQQDDYFYAIGKLRKDFKFLILKSSWIGFKNYENIENSDENFKLLNKYLNNNLIIKDFNNNRYYFKEDVLFDTCSIAAKFIFGNSQNEINGFKKWKEKQSENPIEFFINTKVKKSNNLTKLKSSNYFLNKNKIKKLNSNQYLGEIFYLNYKNKANAKLKITKEKKFLILNGSWVKKIYDYYHYAKYRIELIERNQKIIQKLLDKNIIIFKNDKYIFIKDCDYFKSLSGSAKIFINRSANGKDEWRTKENKTFKKIYEIKK